MGEPTISVPLWILREVLDNLCSATYSWSQTDHYAHFDPTGRGGAGCPACVVRGHCYDAIKNARERIRKLVEAAEEAGAEGDE